MCGGSTAQLPKYCIKRRLPQLCMPEADVVDLTDKSACVQLEGLKALVGNDVRWQPHTAQLLKHCIERQVQVRPLLAGLTLAGVLVSMFW